MNPDLLLNPAYRTILLSDEVEKIKLRQGRVDDTINSKLQIGDHSLLVGSQDTEHARILLEGGSVSMGLNSSAEAANSIAIGFNSEVVGDEESKVGGIAIGHNARANGKEAIAIGKNTQVHNSRIAIGRSQVSIKLGVLVIQINTQNGSVELDLMSTVTDTEDGPDPNESIVGVRSLKLGDNMITFDEENDQVVFTAHNGKHGAIKLNS
jgi:hypothetical protein